MFVAIHAIVTALLVLLGREVVAQSGYSAGATADDSSGVLILYDEQSLPDSSRARIIRLVAAAVSQASWPLIVFPATVDPEVTLNRLFRLWRGRYPVSTDALLEVIIAANRLQNAAALRGRSVRVPPIPVRGDTTFERRRARAEGFALRYRLFDVMSRKYVLFRRDSLSNVFGALFADSLGDAKLPLARLVSGSVLGEVAREATGTVIRLPTENRLAKVVDSIGPSWLPVQATVITQGAFADIRLLGTSRRAGSLLSNTQICGDVQDWIASSPYIPLAIARIGKLTPVARDSLWRRAARTPLLILDWSVGDASGHGRKVLSVAQYLLAHLGLTELARVPYLRTFELNPFVNRNAASDWLTSFGDRLGSRNDLTSSVSFVQNWIETAQEPAGPIEKRVPELYVKAALWKALEADSSLSGAWVNLSFSVASPFFLLEPGAFANSEASFGFVAAGNFSDDWTASAFLQAAASQRPGLINVTYGNAAGTILGLSSNRGGLSVGIVAPGCGFGYGAITPQDSGSSFAAPFVATAGWLSHLLDGITAGDLRHGLLSASVPSPLLKRGAITSEGLFDPGLLLMLPALGSHVVTRNNVVRMLDSVLVDIDIETSAGPETIRGKFRRTGALNRALSVFPCEAGVCAIMRQLGPNDQMPHVFEGTVRSASVMLFSAGAPPESYQDPVHLAAAARLLFF